MSDEDAPQKPQARARASANGTGWGGMARGAHPAKLRFRFPTPGPGRSRGYSVVGEARRDRDERIAEEMRELYYAFATDPEKPDSIRLSAADHLLDRIEGKPVAPVLTATASADDALSRMTDEELVAERCASRKKMLAFLRANFDEGRAPLAPADRALADTYGITTDEIRHSSVSFNLRDAHVPES